MLPHTRLALIATLARVLVLTRGRPQLTSPLHLASCPSPWAASRHCAASSSNATSCRPFLRPCATSRRYQSWSCMATCCAPSLPLSVNSLRPSRCTALFLVRALGMLPPAPHLEDVEEGGGGGRGGRALPRPQLGRDMRTRSGAPAHTLFGTASMCALTRARSPSPPMRRATHPAHAAQQRLPRARARGRTHRRCPPRHPPGDRVEWNSV